jgi:hypothetical protein
LATLPPLRLLPLNKLPRRLRIPADASSFAASSRSRSASFSAATRAASCAFLASIA